MDDRLVRNALLSYIAEGPPMDTTSAAVLAAGRRARRRRRTGVGAATVAGIAALVGLALVAANTWPGATATVELPAGPGWTALDPSPFCAAAAAPAGPQVTTPTGAASEKSGSVVASPTEPTEHAAARLSCYLLREVPQRLPGTTFYRGRGTPDGTLPLQVHLGRAVEPYFTSSAIVADRRGVGTIGFGFAPAQESPGTATADCHAPACKVRTGPHGEVVTVVSAGSGRDGQRQLVNVRVYFGQTVAFASASNTNAVDAATDEAGVFEDLPVGRPDLPLSVDALIDLIATPNLTLFP
ncbi:hypothetical protein ABZS66_36220 [Dactylosporangium sp. NPDC005572]|uniref:hypothetical protein n=1 Tax=Dactylosporangium sp. NPDC005572 TaxID=3156889 RepID=UPI0033B51137